MKTMLAYHSDTKVKTKYLNRVKAHYKADEIIHGTYWENGKGCAVGCTIEGSDHERYETELGIPRAIARLEDRIFEGLKNGESKEFPVKFLKAIKVGADLSMVVCKFLFWLLVDKKDGVIKFAKTEQSKKAIQDVADLFERKIKGENIEIELWQKVRFAAYAAYAAADAADDAADAYAAYAAADAAYAAYAAAYADAYAAYAAADAAYAAYAAADAAYAADDAYAAYAAYAAAARTKHFSLMAEKLLELLKACK